MPVNTQMKDMKVVFDELEKSIREMIESSEDDEQ